MSRQRQVEISFATKKLQALMEDEKALRKAHGSGCGKKIQTRLLDLEAAEDLEAMRRLPGRCHELTGDRAGQLAVSLDDGKRLVFEPSDDPPPAKDDGGLDWQQVKRIRVKEIADYHH